MVIVGLGDSGSKGRTIFSQGENGKTAAKSASYINPYLIDGADVLVKRANAPISELPEMKFGNKPVDGGHLLMSRDDLNALGIAPDVQEKIVKRIMGAVELVSGAERYCLWIENQHLEAS